MTPHPSTGGTLHGMDLRRLAVVLASAALLTACGSTPNDTTTDSPPPTATTSTADIAYLAKVRPVIQGSTDADLIALGHKACTQLDDDTLLNTAGDLTAQGFTTEAAATITTTAVETYCTNHKDKLSQ